MAEEQTDKPPKPTDAPGAWERQHQNFEQRFPKNYVDPEKAKGTPLKLNQKSIFGNPWASNEKFPSPFLDINKYTPQAPTGKPQPNDALKFWQHPSPKVIPIREGAADDKSRNARIDKQQEANKSMLADLKDFLNKHEHLGLAGINQLVQMLNPVSSAQAGEVVSNVDFFKRGVQKDLEKTPEQRKTQETLTRALGGATVLPMTPANK